MATRFFIAEIGSNHNRSWPRTLKLIQKAKEIGCDAVKFQLFDAEKLYAPEFKTQINRMKKWELPQEFIPEIRDICDLEDIEFGCSVFDLESLDFVKDYVNWLKIGSYELLYTDLIKAVIKTGRAWMMSTGMTIMKDILNIEHIGRKYNNPPISILHCNSNYPSKPENCNLFHIRKLYNCFRDEGEYENYRFPPISIGWSDHTTEPGVIYKAIEMGAEVIEFHFDLKYGLGYESKIGHCWEPDKIKEVIDNVKIGELACQENDTDESEAKKWRTDPEDGMRPMKKFRRELLNE